MKFVLVALLTLVPALSSAHDTSSRLPNDEYSRRAQEISDRKQRAEAQALANRTARDEQEYRQKAAQFKARVLAFAQMNGGLSETSYCRVIKVFCGEEFGNYNCTSWYSSHEKGQALDDLGTEVVSVRSCNVALARADRLACAIDIDGSAVCNDAQLNQTTLKIP